MHSPSMVKTKKPSRSVYNTKVKNHLKAVGGALKVHIQNQNVVGAKHGASEDHN